MARLKCTGCGASVGKADVVCRKCGQPLLSDGATEVMTDPPASHSEPVQLAAATPPVQDEPGPPPAAGQCPNCGAGIQDPRHLVCLECFTELAAVPATPGSSEPEPRRTFREAAGQQLVIRFDFGAVELTVGQEVTLGRDTADQRLAALREMDNVSRKHATIGLTPNGAWIRDERSTNGTFVNGEAAPPGAMVALGPDAELRLASNVRATVRLREPGGDD
jgi:hypothetical protein